MGLLYLLFFYLFFFVISLLTDFLAYDNVFISDTDTDTTTWSDSRYRYDVAQSSVEHLELASDLRSDWL